MSAARLLTLLGLLFGPIGLAAAAPDLGAQEAPVEDEEEALEPQEEGEEQGAGQEEAAPPAIDLADLRAKAKEVVDQAPFCAHVPRGLGDARAWCPLVEAERCPGLAKACAAAAEPPQEPFELPPLVGQILLAAVWVAVGLAALFLVVLWLRQAVRLGRAVGEEKRRPGDPPPPLVADPEATPRVVETDVDRLLALAEAELAAGDAARALDHLYAALLRALERAGRLVLDRAKTNGDYVRELAGAPPLADELRAIAALVERAQFGGAPPTAGVVSAALDQVKRAVQRLGAGLVVLLLAVGLGAAGCPGWLPFLGGPDEGPAGSAAIRALLEKTGVEVKLRRAPLASLADGEPAVLLLPDAHPSTADQDQLLAWVRRGGTLVFSGEHRRLLEKMSVAAPVDVPVAGPNLMVSFGEEMVTLRVPGRRRFPFDEELVPFLLDDGGAYAYRFALDRGRVIVFADGALLQNASLAVADNAVALTAEIAPLERVQLVDELTGLAPASPAQAVGRSGLLPFLGQVAVLLLAWFLYRGVRLGAPRDPPVGRRRRFVEHAVASGALYARAQAGRHAFGLYAAWALERLRERTRTQGLPLSALAEAIAARVKRPLGEVMAILVEADAAVKAAAGPDGPVSPADTREAIEGLRALARLIKEQGGNR